MKDKKKKKIRARHKVLVDAISKLRVVEWTDKRPTNNCIFITRKTIEFGMLAKYRIYSYTVYDESNYSIVDAHSGREVNWDKKNFKNAKFCIVDNL